MAEFKKAAALVADSVDAVTAAFGVMDAGKFDRMTPEEVKKFAMDMEKENLQLKSEKVEW